MDPSVEVFICSFAYSHQLIYLEIKTRSQSYDGDEDMETLAFGRLDPS